MSVSPIGFTAISGNSKTAIRSFRASRAYDSVYQRYDRDKPSQRIRVDARAFITSRTYFIVRIPHIHDRSNRPLETTIDYSIFMARRAAVKV